MSYNKPGPWLWNPWQTELPRLASRATFLAPLWEGTSAKAFDYASRVLGDQPNAGNEVAWNATDKGYSAFVADTSDDALIWPDTPSHRLDADIDYSAWVAVDFVAGTAGNNIHIFSCHGSFSANMWRIIRQTNRLRVQIHDGSLTTVLDKNTGWSDLNPPGYATIGFVRRKGGTDWRLYANGSEIATASNTYAFTGANTQEISIGGAANANDTGQTGYYLTAAVWKGTALTPEEFKILHENPYGMITPRAPIFALFPAAAGVTVEPPSKALTLAEQVPVLDYGLGVPLKTLTLAEQVPSVFETENIAVPSKALTLAEQVPSLDYGLGVPLKTLTLAEQAPSLDYGLGIPLKTLTLGEQVPSVFETENIAVPLKSFTLAEQVPVLDYAIGVPLKAFTLAEQVPTVLEGADITLQIPSKALTLAEQVPGLDLALGIPVKAFTLAEQGPALDMALGIPLKAITLAEQVPTIDATANVNLAVPLKTFALTGLAPTVLAGADIVLQVPLKALTLAEQVPVIDVSNNIFVNVPAGTFTLAEQVPTVSFTADVTLSVPLKALNFAAAVPTVQGTLIPVHFVIDGVTVEALLRIDNVTMEALLTADLEVN